MLCRTLAEILKKHWKHPLIAVNKPGAAGAIALKSWKEQKSEEERASGSAVAVATPPVEEEREEATAPAPAIWWKT